MSAICSSYLPITIIERLNMSIIEKIKRPFSMDYVVRITAKHMRKCVNVSIQKTFERIEEFAEDREKSAEIFKTLSILHQMRKQIDDLLSKYSKDIKGA
jgi:hypothetical protein